MKLDWSIATVLSLVEFDVCWDLLTLGETPSPLDLPSPGRTAQERQSIVAAVLEDLRRRGLADHDGPRPDIAGELRRLAAARLTLDIRLRTGSLVTGVATCRPGRGVLAVRHQDRIGVLRIPREGAAAALADLLGPITPGPGRVVNLLADILDGARAASRTDPVRFADELVRRGTTARDAQALVHMCRAADGRGQLGASARTPGRRGRRAAYVIGVHHTPSGHYRQLRRPGPGGRDIVTIGPLDRAGLIRDLDELAATVDPTSL
ncbi:ESX secretion-associated protein EspG [Pseudonocardia hispaniensis]|uniref:ESX secretion-associated protein EspG n=1 Tax=Pseudonocardia hispaniensis TaxID=904933 RepID=A0ABW1J5A1_9PSEU